MITRTKVSLLAMLLIAAASLVYISQVGLHIAALSKTRTASMVVPDTNSILVDSRVLLRGVPVGYVRDITPGQDGVRIEWDYAESVNIPVDSTFRVDNLSALGEAYILVMPNSQGGPYLDDGAEIDRTHVSVPTSFNELAERLTTLLKEVDPDRVGGIFETLDSSLPDQLSVISDLDRAGRLLADELGQHSDSLATLLSAMQPLLARTGTIPAALAGTAPQLDEFGLTFQDLLNSIVDAMNLGGPLLDGTKYGASPLLAGLQEFLDRTSGDLNVIGVNLLPATSAASASMRTVDVSRLLDRALDATSEPGVVDVRIPSLVEQADTSEQSGG